MTNFSKRVEVVSNFAIILVAVVLCVVLVKGYFFPRAAAKSPTRVSAISRTTSNQTAVGSKLSLPNVDWAKNGRTLVMALQVGCHFCSDSAPFYQELVKAQAAKSNVKLVAVLPQAPDASQQYLSSLGVPALEIRQASLASMAVAGTPTLLLVDGNGTVTDAWVGRLASDGQTAVLKKLQQS